MVTLLKCEELATLQHKTTLHWSEMSLYGPCTINLLLKCTCINYRIYIALLALFFLFRVFNKHFWNSMLRTNHYTLHGKYAYTYTSHNYKGKKIQYENQFFLIVYSLYITHNKVELHVSEKEYEKSIN